MPNHSHRPDRSDQLRLQRESGVKLRHTSGFGQQLDANDLQQHRCQHGCPGCILYGGVTQCGQQLCDNHLQYGNNRANGRQQLYRGKRVCCWLLELRATTAKPPLTTATV